MRNKLKLVAVLALAAVAGAIGVGQVLQPQMTPEKGSFDKAAGINHYANPNIGESYTMATEANMPGWTEIARYLHVSTFKDWDAVGKWYWNLVREQLVVDHPLQSFDPRNFQRGADGRHVRGVNAGGDTGHYLVSPTLRLPSMERPPLIIICT